MIRLWLARLIAPKGYHVQRNRGKRSQRPPVLPVLPERFTQDGQFYEEHHYAPVPPVPPCPTDTDPF